MTNSLFDQAFFDNLPLCICPNLICIEINDDARLSISYNFILNFKLLQHFKTNQQFESAFDLVIKSFARLEDFYLFNFRLDNHLIVIRKHWANYSLYDLVFYDFDQGLISDPTFTKEAIDFSELTMFCTCLKDKDCIMTRRRAKFFSNFNLF